MEKINIMMIKSKAFRKQFRSFKTFVKLKVKTFAAKRKYFLLCLIVVLFGILYLLIRLEQSHQLSIIMQALGSRNTKDLLRLNEDTTILDAMKGCQFNGRNLDATILVTTLSSSRVRRETIRKTWAGWKYEYNVMVFFFAGKVQPYEMEAIKKENQLHGDLIIEDLEESYHSLTLKTLRMLKWYLRHCPKSTFLIKADDDVFINVPNMLKYLQTIKPVNQIDSTLENPQGSASSLLYQNYIGGLVHVGRQPHTWNPFSKWYVPPELWPMPYRSIDDDNKNNNNFPPYVGGPCYILSSPIVKKLLEISLDTPLFNLEDVYLTGLIASDKLKIQLQTIPNLYDAHYPRLNRYFSGQDYINSCTAYHTDGDVRLMYELYDQILSSST